MSEVAEKWGDEVARRGFAQIPNYLLLINQFLHEDERLSSVELLTLIQLSSAWWKKDQLPFPSANTLAKRCGVSERQIHRAVSKLQNIGLLKKVSRRRKGVIASNEYDLRPLVNILNEIAKIYPNEFPRNVTAKKFSLNEAQSDSDDLF